MTSKKYESRVTQVEDSWKAEIVRRVSARKSNVSKKQAGFATEAEAQTWADAELAKFLDNQGQRNERKAQKRQVRTEALEAKALAASLALEAKENAEEGEESEEGEAWGYDDDEELG